MLNSVSQNSFPCVFPVRMDHRRYFCWRFERPPFTGKVRVATGIFSSCLFLRTCWLTSLVWTAAILQPSIFPYIFLRLHHVLGGFVFISDHLMVRGTNFSCRTAPSSGGSENGHRFSSSSCPPLLHMDPSLPGYSLFQLQAM